MTHGAPLCPKCCLLMRESLEPGRFVCAACGVHAAKPSILPPDRGFRFWIEESDGMIVQVEVPIDGDE